MRFRRVVSGQTADGRAAIVSDEMIEAARRGTMGGVGIWGGDGVPRTPNDGTPPGPLALFPGPGGWRCSIMVVHPDDHAPTGPGNALSEAFAAIQEADAPGMHATDTVDVEVVLSGTVSIELDDGIVTTLGPGDCFVQNGTRHRWFTHGPEPAVVAVVIIGGARGV